MANPRTRKRVRALRRAPDGSAFQKCDDCGVTVAVVLMDMHECKAVKKMNKDVKRFKGKCEAPVVRKTTVCEEPRSAFQFFLESYTKTRSDGDMLEVNREAFGKWKTMSNEERWPYILQAEKVEKAYMEVLQHEVEQLSQEYDDEADSAAVRKLAQKHYNRYENSDDSGSYHRCWSDESEGSDDDNCLNMVQCPWHS